MRLSCFLDILEIVIKYLLGKHAFIGKKIRDLNKMIYLLFLSKSKLSSRSDLIGENPQNLFIKLSRAWTFSVINLGIKDWTPSCANLFIDLIHLGYHAVVVPTRDTFKKRIYHLSFKGIESLPQTQIIQSRWHFLMNWVFATNSNLLIPISLQPDVVNLWYFKLRLFDLTEFIVWNIKGLHHQFAKILGSEDLSLWQKLNSFKSVIVNVQIKRCCLAEFYIKVLTSGEIV